MSEVLPDDEGTLIGDVETRLWKRVDRSGGPDACHPWTAYLSEFGTPSLFVSRRIGGKMRKGSASARKLAWQFVNGPVPSEHLVMVTCGNRQCMNVRHMALESRRAEDMFWSQVKKTDGCWLWTGYIRKAGYGAFMYAGLYRAAHRFSYELHHGPIPKDGTEWCVCHTCDNPTCVKPEHLFLGTDKDNMHDCIAKGRNSRGPEHGKKAAAGRARAREQRIAALAGERHGEEKEEG